ncbi:MAG: hypothetical protein ACRD5L_09035, partial [Bryobacteraceae bacterium]
VDLLPVVLGSGNLEDPGIVRFRAKRARLTADRDLLFHGDGEVFGHAPVQLEVLPGAIEVAVPGKT